MKSKFLTRSPTSLSVLNAFVYRGGCGGGCGVVCVANSRLAVCWILRVGACWASRPHFMVAAYRIKDPRRFGVRPLGAGSAGSYYIVAGEC